MQHNRKPTTRLVAQPEWRSLIVGVHVPSKAVHIVIVYKSGAMHVGDVTYIPSPGRTAVGEAMTRIGLTEIKRFGTDELGEAVAYAFRLEVALLRPKRAARE